MCVEYTLVSTIVCISLSCSCDDDCVLCVVDVESCVILSSNLVDVAVSETVDCCKSL